MPRRRYIRPLALLATVGALVLAGCGGGDGPQEEAGPASAEAESVEHIHGLGVDPRDATLYVATHFGLFRAARDETELERIGDSTQDIMGFSVVERGRFLGSEHPDPARICRRTSG
jgi:hypothetical protein